MSAEDRRTFLRKTGAALGAAALGGASASPGEVAAEGGPLQAAVGGLSPHAASGDSQEVPRTPLDPELLRATAEAVLPAELSEAERERAVGLFEAWLTAYEPVPELNHGYGTSRIRYGPPDPGPGWQAHLQALDLEAGKRHGSGFADLDVTTRQTLIRGQVRDRGEGLPQPLSADHVAVALMAHYFRSSEATDRCYEVRIGNRVCRGLEGLATEPEAL